MPFKPGEYRYDTQPVTDFEFGGYEMDIDDDDVRFVEDGADIAEMVANRYHDHEEGFLSEWPIKFWVYDPDHNLIGVFEVFKHERPSFNAVQDRTHP